MDTKDWILVMGPLIGVLLGGSITSVAKFFELRTAARFDLKKLRVNKIEELCQEIGVLKNSVSKCAEAVQIVVDSGKRGKEVQDAYVPHYEYISNSFERIRVLQSNYAENAKPLFEDLKKAWNSVIDALYSTAFHDSTGLILQEAVYQLKARSLDLQDSLSLTTRTLLRDSRIRDIDR